MGLADELEQAAKELSASRKLRCDVLLEQLEAKDREAFQAAISSDMSPRRLAQVMSRNGHSLSEAAVRTWRGRQG